jgi:arylsulfatase
MDLIIRRRYFVPFLVVALGLSAAACGAPKPGPRQAIVILLDAARPDRFSGYGYGKATTPEIDRLARGGVVFLNCYAQGTETRTAVPRLLYSRYFAPEIFPNHHSILYTDPGRLFQKIDDEAISLPRALEANGFLTAAISAHEWISGGTLFAREFLDLYDLQSLVAFDREHAYPRADQVVDYALDWTGRNRKRPFLLYLHVMDSHFPHLFEEDARAFFGRDRYEGDAFAPSGQPKDPNRELGPADRAYLDALYDGGLRYADRQIGRLVRALEKRGRLDETLIVVTSDHGEFLLDRPGHFGHGAPWYEPAARIPLIVHYPQKIKPATSETLCEQIDIAPTVLGLLGAAVPRGKSFDGEDLFAAGTLPSVTAMSEMGIRDGRSKVVVKAGVSLLLGGSDLPPALGGLDLELYDLRADPGESRNLFPADPEAARPLLEAYRSGLAASYRRYLAATTHDQPAYSFAVSCASFGPAIAIPHVPIEENPANLLGIPAPSGWLGRASWDNSWLFARRGAAPLKIRFPIPNGKYFLTADVQGSAALEIANRRIPLASETVQGTLRWDARPVEIGEIDIAGETFEATLRPRVEESWFAIRYLGFDPIVNGRRGGNYEAEREKRLKSLGYIK